MPLRSYLLTATWATNIWEWDQQIRLLFMAILQNNAMQWKIGAEHICLCYCEQLSKLNIGLVNGCSETAIMN